MREDLVKGIQIRDCAGEIFAHFVVDHAYFRWKMDYLSMVSDH